jgi:hypothetical protein
MSNRELQTEMAALGDERDRGMMTTLWLSLLWERPAIKRSNKIRCQRLNSVIIATWETDQEE